MNSWLVSSSASVHFGLFILRVGIGLVFMMHGYGKLLGGPSSWQWLGSQMGLLGITFLPKVWGLLAACAEFIGGFCLLVGLGTRIAAFFMLCVMIVALVMHFNKGDNFTTYSHALSLAVVFISLIISGPGSYSLDHYLYEKSISKMQ